MFTEQLSHELAATFASKCFTSLEITHFKDNFRTHADHQDGVNFRGDEAETDGELHPSAHENLRYWKEETLSRFLHLPERTGPVVFHMATYLGAFPFPSLAPSILTIDALVKVIVIMTERYTKVLKRGKTDRNKLLFCSLAVFDRRISSPKMPPDHASLEKVSHSAISRNSGSAMDAVDKDEEDTDADEDDLALAALESLDALDTFSPEPSSDVSIQDHQIPPKNFRHLLILLLIVAPLTSQENLSQHVARFTEARMEDLRRTADSILWAFISDASAGIFWSNFRIMIATSLPFLFDGLNPLFEHFLFSKNIDLSRRESINHMLNVQSVPPPLLSSDAPLEPLLPYEGEILNLTTLCQLSFFIKSSKLFRRLRPLYSGSIDGFSIGSFEHKIVNWRAPTILLVAGTLIPSPPSSAAQRSFGDKLPPKRFPDGTTGSSKIGRVVYGAYLRTPWKQTFKEAIGDESTLLFQLEPVHEVFPPSSLNRNYATFTRSAVAVGCPPPRPKPVSGLDRHAALGPVSLFLDEALEHGVFTHDSAGGGAFHTSRVRKTDWQDRFEIEALEVWGCGGDDEAEKQRKAWAWEEREAMLRRNMKLGKDHEADRALLEMAGLVGGQGRDSGGSV